MRYGMQNCDIFCMPRMVLQTKRESARDAFRFLGFVPVRGRALDQCVDPITAACCTPDALLNDPR